MNKQNDLSKRIKERMFLLGFSNVELGKRVGVSDATVSKWASGKVSTIRHSYVFKLAKALKCDPIWLLTGDSSAQTSDVIAIDDDIENYPEFIEIKAYSIHVGAGEKEPPTFDEIQDYVKVPYRRDFFINKGINPNHCKRFVVSGDSMSPLLNNGDYVLCDCSPNQAIRDGDIYVFTFENIVRVKRLFLLMSNEVKVVSDNSKIEPFVIKPDDSFKIIGRVIERSGFI